MSSRFWRKRKIKKKGFRKLCILQLDNHNQGFQPVYTKTKTIYKQVYTTIQHRNIIHNTYPLTIHLYSQNTLSPLSNLTTFYRYQNLRSPYMGAICSFHPLQTFYYKNTSPNVHHLMEERIHMEQQYFQSHPSKAKQLALSYLQQGILQNTLQQYLSTSNQQQALILKPMKKTTLLQHLLSIKEMQNIYQPYLHEEIQHSHYASPMLRKKEIHQEQELTIIQEQKKTDETAKIDISKLVRYVYEEVMRRLKQEGIRKGRR